MVHIDGMSHGDILSAVIATTTTAPIAPTTAQIFSPSSAVIVPPATSSTTTTTASAVEDCFDTPNWTDAYGQDCAYYAYNGGYRCALWGRDPGALDGSYGVALDNCCACGGGGIDTSLGSGGVTTATTTTTTDDEGKDDDNAVMVVGTCGKGERGNGICANGKCCSEVREMLLLIKHARKRDEKRKKYIMHTQKWCGYLYYDVCACVSCFCSIHFILSATTPIF
jgi:hypothetical protein